jgi:hypothetical protein
VGKLCAQAVDKRLQALPYKHVKNVGEKIATESLRIRATEFLPTQAFSA